METGSAPSSNRIPPEERNRIIQAVAAWLDAALEEEQPPAGLTPELVSALRNGDPLPPLEDMPSSAHGGDLYSMWAAVTTLAQEVRVQGRLFKQLSEAVVGKAQSREECAVENPAETGDAVNPQAALSGVNQPRKQEIDLLIDLRDRMQRGIATSRDAATELDPARLPRVKRLLGIGRGYAHHAQEILGAVSHGYSLSLDRLDEALVACGVDRIACLNRAFDPQRMTAIDIEETSTVPEGTVIQVYRDGYEWKGTTYRTAQVKVARKTEN